MASASRRPASASRYSSRYFTGGSRWGELARPSSSLALDLLEVGEDLCGFVLVDPADGEPHVDQHVVADFRLGSVGQAGILEDAAEVDLAHGQIVLHVDFDQPTGYAETHDGILSANDV